MITVSSLPKRSRHERKLAQRAVWAQRAAFERVHPVLSGAVKIVDYIPPYGQYIPATLTKATYATL